MLQYQSKRRYRSAAYWHISFRRFFIKSNLILILNLFHIFSILLDVVLLNESKYVGEVEFQYKTCYWTWRVVLKVVLCYVIHM